MNKTLGRLELLTAIKTYNKNNAEKIKNADKLKKEDLIKICDKYGITNKDHNSQYNTTLEDIHNVSKYYLIQDIDLYYHKKKLIIPPDIVKMKRADIINFMIHNNIPHYNKNMLTQEILQIENEDEYKKIITYNIIRYNIEYDIDTTDKKAYIEKNKLDKDISHLDSYITFVNELYESYVKFSTSNPNIKFVKPKFKSIPNILLQIIENTEGH